MFWPGAWTHALSPRGLDVFTPAPPPQSPAQESSALAPLVPVDQPTKADAADRHLAQLLTRVQDGDEAAFAELHAQTCHRLYRAVDRILRSADLTEDVVQDAYFHIWRQRHKFQPHLGSAMGWMTTIARRRAIDRVRNLTGSRKLQTRYAMDRTSSADTDHQTTVTDAVAAETVVCRALDMLTSTQREALRLTYWDGRTAAQAAQLLGIPIPTMKSRLHSGITRLRSLNLLPGQLA